MKKILILTAILLLVGGISLSYADDLVQLACDPPTHRIANDDCNQMGSPITPAEAATLEYTLSYRVKDSGSEWTNVDEPAPTATVNLLGYEVTYELTMGARWPGGTIVCTSPLLEHTTAPDTAEPGPCTNLRKTAVQ